MNTLKLITAGSVDDGKSTLIGRLLYDSKTLTHDQLASIDSDSDTPDFASLTDGLSAEREQGITIDVAYRYFATPKRKFILADTPGHEQYTRNMVTGASTADAAIILIDATRVQYHDHGAQLLPQTKRHSAILKLLNVRHLIIAINKLDLIDYDQTKYDAIIAAYDRIAATLGLGEYHTLPISALKGDNIITPSSNTPWYHGAPLLPYLETLPDPQNQRQNAPLILPIQRIARQDGSLTHDFRGYQGRIEQGEITLGQSVRLEPQNLITSVTSILTINGETERAAAGENITVTLAHDLDISRGNTLLSAKTGPSPSRNLYATLCWFDHTPLNPARRYLLKHSSNTVTAKIRGIDFLLDLNTLQYETSEQTMTINDIGRVRLALQHPITATAYQENRHTGAFILIDDTTNQTVAAGMINATDNPDPNEWTI